MVDIENNRWVTPENVFACRVILPDLNNVFEPEGFFRWLARKSGAKSIVIEPGTIAYFIEHGQTVGHLPAGQHTMKGVMECLTSWKIKQATVILTHGEDQRLDIQLTDIPTREGFLVDASIRLSIQICDVALFLDNYIGVQSEITFDNIRENLLPLIIQSAKQAIRLRTRDELQSEVMAEILSATISEQLTTRMKRYGLSFVQIETLDITHQDFDALHEKRGEIWRSEQDIQARQKQPSADGEDAGPAKETLEHLKRALEEIKQAIDKLGGDR
jgi:hypothetical protein